MGRTKAGVVMEEFLAAEYFGLGAGVWIGIGAGIVVLIVLVIVLLTRAGKSKPPLKSHAPLGEKTQPFPSGRSAPPKPDGTASASPREEVVFAVDFSRDTMEGWQNIKGGEPPGQIVDGWYRLGAAQGARTADTLPVKPGERFRLEWRVRDATESRVGGKYAVGPLFYR